MGDDEDGKPSRCRHAAHEAKHFIGFLRRQHGGRFIEDQEACIEIELFEDFRLLLFAGGEAVGGGGRAAR